MEALEGLLLLHQISRSIERAPGWISTDSPNRNQGSNHNSGGAEDKCQKIGHIEDKMGSNVAKDDQVEDRS